MDFRKLLDPFWGFTLKTVLGIHDPRISWLLFGTKNHEMQGPPVVKVKNVELLYTKGRLSYHLCIECFSQLSFDSEVYTKSATAADFVYISESNEIWEKYSTQRMIGWTHFSNQTDK